MSDENQRERHTEALSDILAAYIPEVDYNVTLHEGRVEVRARDHKWSFAVVLLNRQDLSELALALNEAQRRGENPIDELAIQMGYLVENDSS